MKTPKNIITSAAIILALTALGVSPANAQTDPDDPLAALAHTTDQANSSSEEVLNNIAVPDKNSDPDVAIAASANGNDIVVPVTPTDPITIDNVQSGSQVSVTIPNSDVASSTESVIPGVATFDNNDGSSTSAVTKLDGSLQLATVLTGPESPDTVTYDISSGGGSLLLQPDGSVLITDADSNVIGTIDAPWAKDAVGNTVPTHYEIDGTLLTQVIDHRTDNVVYPVVADPSIGVYWWGIAVKFNKSETKKIANSSSNAGALSIACGLIASAPGAVACGAAGFVIGGVSSSWAKGVAKRGKCIQLSQTWALGVPAWPVEVGC